MPPIMPKPCTALFDSRRQFEELLLARSQTGTTKCRVSLRISGVCTNLPLGTGLFYSKSAKLTATSDFFTR